MQSAAYIAVKYPVLRSKENSPTDAHMHIWSYYIFRILYQW